MGQLSEIENELLDMGYRIVAVSPDRPAKLTETIEAIDLPYTLLSDSSMTGAKSLGIAIQFNELKVAMYKLGNNDIESASGQDHHLVPVPTVFIVDKSGVIRFVHSDPNHRIRLEAQALLTAAKLVFGL
ncbi:redoxin domain-containing protein [bacterium]|nr:redoxin domain-containing protein [bacterium]